MTGPHSDCIYITDTWWWYPSLLTKSVKFTCYLLWAWDGVVQSTMFDKEKTCYKDWSGVLSKTWILQKEWCCKWHVYLFKKSYTIKEKHLMTHDSKLDTCYVVRPKDKAQHNYVTELKLPFATLHKQCSNYRICVKKRKAWWHKQRISCIAVVRDHSFHVNMV